MKLAELELLIRVAETGSMTHAAKQLNLTPAAVSAAIQRLEQALQVRLFERTTRTLHPTEACLLVLEGSVDILDRWRHVLHDLHTQDRALEGRVHLSAPADTSYQLIESAVAQLCLEHPGLQIVLNASDVVQHLHRDAIDLAIRYGELQDSTMTARRLVTAPDILVASPSYLEAHGHPQDISALVKHRCLTLQLSNAPVTSWRLTDGQHTHLCELQQLICGDGFLTRRWAIAGVGIALKNLFDVIEDLQTGRLVHVLPQYHTGTNTIWMLFPSRRFMPTRVRVIGDTLAAAFEAREHQCQQWLNQSNLSP